jgi:glyoxylase-like metal-dependent hydrolase (beta-lactamase superfamily II)
MKTQPPIEDSIFDILQKSRTGLGLGEATLQDRCGLSAEALQRVCRGEGTKEELAAVAPILELSASKLAALASGTAYGELINPPVGVAMFTTTFGDMLVNSYLVWDAKTSEAAAFDTGADAGEMLDFLAENKLRLRQIFLTHAHGDHIFDLDRLVEKSDAEAFIGEREAIPGTTPISAGQAFSIGSLAVETRLTWGHSPGGITYVIQGLERPVAIVGDAIFAGSVGGGKVSYRDALRTVREEILTLPTETLLCPGHGPLTTVGRELANNPFF